MKISNFAITLFFVFLLTFGFTSFVSSNETVQQNNSNTLQILKHDSKGMDYVFVCNIQNFNPVNYSWFYGDGEKLIDVSNRDTYHVYENPGEYTVRCIGTDGIQSEELSSTLSVTSSNQIQENQNVNADNNESETKNKSNSRLMCSFNLSGNQEVPELETNASGSVNIYLDGPIIRLEGEYHNLSSPLHIVSGSSAHIHEGSPDENGEILYNLEINQTDNNSGTFTFSKSLFLTTMNERDLLKNNSLYINLHTTNNPNGELRANILSEHCLHN